ncbi:MAG: enoyl-CoA hydratase/isomerase family protein [Acidobacteria bacterium]|nr:enoyl-CoA hydratase/isomerase family protein [Acidobacteriota bacterium]
MKIRAEQNSPAYWRVVIDNPPNNLFDQELAAELQSLLAGLETDEDVRIVVFESANPNYFIAPADLIGAGGYDEERALSGPATFRYFLKQMEQANFLTVGVLRGHAGGTGSEFFLGLDIRFASREKAVLSQIDPGSEFSAHQEGFDRLCALVGRTRALEIILEAEDLDADTAERLNLINRSVPDAGLDLFIERFASHVGGFTRENIAFVKRAAGERSGQSAADDDDTTPMDALASLKWSETRERIASPAERVWHRQDYRDLPLGEQFRPDYD